MNHQKAHYSDPEAPKNRGVKARGLIRFKKSVLSGIRTIKPRLHRIILSGNYSYKELESKLGKLKIDGNYIRKRRMPPYKKRAFGRINGRRLTIYYDPIGYAPKCRIEFTFSTRDVLLSLSNRLSHLKVSSVEYTVDFFCHDHRQVAKLFYLFLHYMYFEYQTKDMEHFGGEFTGFNDKRSENAGFHFGDNAKVYERGYDKDKQKHMDPKRYGKPFWPHKKLNRVRVEFTFDRDHPGKNGLNTLAGLIRRPRLKEKLYEKFQFKVFTKSNKLPRETEDYWYRDQNGGKVYTEIFQEIYYRTQKLGLRMQQCIIDAEGYEELKQKILSAMEKYGQRWNRWLEAYEKASGFSRFEIY